MRDYILESIFLEVHLWEEVISHGVGKNISYELLEKFSDPHYRADLCISIGEGRYEIQHPHTGYRKKDDGGERMFLANEPQDRLLLNAIYKWLSINERSLIHPSCKSYQSGIGIGKIVKEISRKIQNEYDEGNKIIGRKFDIQKYFESIPRIHLLNILSKLEKKYGNSSIIDLLRSYYESDIYYDSRKHSLVNQYQGIKQGCAVSAWMANVLLYELDEKISSQKGLYVRYSDDILYLGEDYEEVTDIIKKELAKFDLSLNERKILDIYADEYFCFLGFEIHKNEITLSKKWVKNFQKEINRLTIKNKRLIRSVRNKILDKDKKESQRQKALEIAIRNVSRFLYYGNGKFSWATEVLPTVNNKKDLLTLSTYCLDALRAVYTGKTNIGGLGKSLCTNIQRGKGRNVASNLKATKHLEGPDGILKDFVSLLSMQNNISNKWLFRTVLINKLSPYKYPKYGQIKDSLITRNEMIDQLENLYENYLKSQPIGKKYQRFYAFELDEMSLEILIKASSRNEALRQMENFLVEKVDFSVLRNQVNDWYWQSERFPQLVILKEWFADNKSEISE